MSDFTPYLGTATGRAAIRQLTRAPEAACVQALMDEARVPAAQALRVHALACQLAEGVRAAARGRTGLLGSGGRAGLVQSLLQEFALSSQEGVALMCLAEALLRIPDAATRDALIRDKIARGDWRSHLGRSPSLFVNAAAWGLLLTGQLVATHSSGSLGGALRQVLARGGEPLIRKGVDMAMRLMGEQFVTGQTIEEALQRAQVREAEGFRYSYDMLGEAALTEADAQRYLQAYAQAIEAIGRAAQGRGVIEGPGISIKLSALHPRYGRAQLRRVTEELYPRLLHLVRMARQHDIGLNIDAEEADRLDLSLDLLERLCAEPALAGWNGLGFVIQAYGKRCPAVVDFLIDLARRSGRRLMVRLVKGAYWDSEIKRAQLDGLDDYPVYTRKAHTDVAYLACARRLLAAPDAVFPQFATHNAHTLAAVHEMAGGLHASADAYEFQCLHGMGEPLYEQVVAAQSPDIAPSDRHAWRPRLSRPCRIYAPVGTHETLLAYLVRRLLENGANASFVHRVADETLPIETLVEDPVRTVEALGAAEGRIGLPHPAIPLPPELYGPTRRNVKGLDLADEDTLRRLGQALAAPWRELTSSCQDVPADQVRCVVQTAVAASRRAFNDPAGWPSWPAPRRADALDRAAHHLEARTDALVPWLVHEAGKTVANAVAEIREAVDFLRHDAQQLRAHFDNATHRPLGPVLCISPWNFPLAIFMGQVAAALASGNTVLAKPAEQTPRIARAAVQALWDAGVPKDALQLLPGPGETVGAALVAHPDVQAVVFTGSTEVARLLQGTLARRLDACGQPVTLIAETGGQNAMLVDSSALPEQVTQDVLSSAFDSAGQRCSALRVLCVQEEMADRLIAMIEGAMRELRVGDPGELSTDVGPVIDKAAQQAIEAHIAALRARGLRVVQPVGVSETATGQACFVPPTLIEIDSLSVLKREVFGPVLHVLRYPREALPEVLAQIRATGYGLTMGVHTRIDETIAQVVAASPAGNLYVNRNMVGAVVGVQPFGGEGLSGTGPKAGGPLYLLRLLSQRPGKAARDAVEACAQPCDAPVRGLNVPGPGPAPFQAFVDWALASGHEALRRTALALAEQVPAPGWRHLRGPTGEANLYAVSAREHVLCLGDGAGGGDGACGSPGSPFATTAAQRRLALLAAVWTAGGVAVWPARDAAALDPLPAALRSAVRLADDWQAPTVPVDIVLHTGSAASLSATLQAVADRPGPLLGVVHVPPEGWAGGAVPMERLLVERSLSINTAAAGGNASLMMLG